jgi:succinylarginine dihydrolase
MKLLADLGVKQAVLPPQERPDVATLRQLGFTGSDSEVIERAAREAPQLLAACSSASSMWAANAATLSPSGDTADTRLHLTPANLVSHFHRSLETATTSRILHAIFPGPLFAHHDALPPTSLFADEGAANHSRLSADPAGPGIELFVYGFDPQAETARESPHFHPRHSRLASNAIARLHHLHPDRTFFVRQNPEAVNAGAFHNDVIAVAHRNLLIYHEHAWVDSAHLLAGLKNALPGVCKTDLHAVCIPASLLPLQDAIRSYLFNSQIVSLPTGGMLLLAPLECTRTPPAAAAIDFIRQHAPAIEKVLYVDVRQSMRNGGGPACLRLRVELTDDQQAAIHPGVLFTQKLYDNLRDWVQRHYRTEINPADLSDPHLLEESRRALDELTRLLHLPGFYSFQRS